MQLLEQCGDREYVPCFNGWSAWTDGCRPVFVPLGSPAVGAPTARTAAPRPLLMRTREAPARYRTAVAGLADGGTEFSRRSGVPGDSRLFRRVEHGAHLVCLLSEELRSVRETKTLLPRSVEEVHTGLATLPTQTRASERRIALPARCVQSLKLHHEQQEREREAAGTTWQHDAHVFTPVQGRPIDPTALTRTFTTILRRAGFRRIRFHDLRHSTAPLLLERECLINGGSDDQGDARDDRHRR